MREALVSEAKTTTDHSTIRKWIEKRGGAPAAVSGTGKGKDAGVLRVDFGPKEKELDQISWDEFFRKFEKAQLAFLYQERTADGEESRFHKFVER
jgi:hypothetical protein